MFAYDLLSSGDQRRMWDFLKVRWDCLRSLRDSLMFYKTRSFLFFFFGFSRLTENYRMLKDSTLMTLTSFIYSQNYATWGINSLETAKI